METDDAEGHLLQARARLAGRLAAIEREGRDVAEAIDGIDTVIRQIKRKVPHIPRVAQEAAARSRPSTTTGAPGTARTAILQLMATADRPFRTSEIVRRVSEFGTDTHKDTIRSLVSRMRHEGQIEQVERGLYRLPGSYRPDERTMPAEPPEVIRELISDTGTLLLDATEDEARPEDVAT